MMYQDFDQDQDLDLNIRSDSDKALSSVKRLGSEFVISSKLLDHPDEALMPRSQRRSIKEARIAAIAYLKEQKLSPLAVWRVFEAAYGDELTVNSWTGEVFLRNPRTWTPEQKTTAAKLLTLLEDALGIALLLPRDFLVRRLEDMFEHSQFSPVQSYLRNLPRLEPSGWDNWGKLAEILFGASDHMSQVKLSRWLIGAVARVMEPGCKMDSALVIRGKQGIGKTSFLQALFGEHFRTLHSHQSTLEQQRVLQQAWGCELGELEATFRAKDISALKAFLTETHDSFRNLNKELGEPRPRHCVFAGTTNESAFLNDPTGNRRFWVIDAGSHPIPVEWVRKNRDHIWSVAHSLWASGDRHWMTSEEAELSELGNKAYQTENSFEEALRTSLDILEGLHGAIAISASDALRYILDIKPENYKRHDRELRSAMESLGYTRKNFNNKRLKGWHYVKPDATDPVPFNVRMADEVVAKRLGTR